MPDTPARATPLQLDSVAIPVRNIRELLRSTPEEFSRVLTTESVPNAIIVLDERSSHRNGAEQHEPRTNTPRLPAIAFLSIVLNHANATRIWNWRPSRPTSTIRDKIAPHTRAIRTGSNCPRPFEQ